MNTASIRTATEQDMPDVHSLIRELAHYEKAAAEVEITVEILTADGFGPGKIFDCFVAEMNGEVVGFALFYTKYSTWKGKCLFLEDFVIRENLRGKGIGKQLFEAVIGVACERKVKRMEWQVLDWNEPALNFYRKYGANLDPEWINGKLVFEQLQSFGA
jgi:GNAT superfamily N-acetyltransferase